jgi:hypothetical protein
MNTTAKRPKRGRLEAFYTEKYDHDVVELASIHKSIKSINLKYGRKRGVGSDRYSHSSKIDDPTSNSPGEDYLEDLNKMMFRLSNDSQKHYSFLCLLHTFLRLLADKSSDQWRGDDSISSQLPLLHVQILSSSYLVFESLQLQHFVNTNLTVSFCHSNRYENDVYKQIIHSLLKSLETIIDRNRDYIAAKTAAAFRSSIIPTLEKNPKYFLKQDYKIDKESSLGSSIIDNLWKPLRHLLSVVIFLPSADCDLSNICPDQVTASIQITLESVCNATLKHLLAYIQSKCMRFTEEGIYIFFNDVSLLVDWIQGTKSFFAFRKSEVLIQKKIDWERAESILILLLSASQPSGPSSKLLRGSSQTASSKKSIKKQDSSAKVVTLPVHQQGQRKNVLSGDEVESWKYLYEPSYNIGCQCFIFSSSALTKTSRVFANIEIDYSRL